MYGYEQGTAPNYPSLEDLERRLLRLKNTELRKILTALSLTKSGIKLDLVKKLIRHVRTRPVDEPTIIKMLNSFDSSGKSKSFLPANIRNQVWDMPTNRPSHPISIQNNINISINGVNDYNRSMGGLGSQAQEFAKKYLTCITNEDIFYMPSDIVESLIVFRMPTTESVFSITAAQRRLIRETNSKILLYSVELSNVEICKEHAWPNRLEIKLNDVTVPIVKKHFNHHKKKKSKAVRERPADLTTVAKTGMNYINLTGQPDYIKGDWAFAMRIVISRVVELRTLIAKVPIVPKTMAINLLNLDYGDEVEITSKQKAPLKDPLTLCTLKNPSRGRDCAHIACFDLETFLNFQKEGKNAQWKCVICGKGPYKLEDLVICSWTKEVMESLRLKYKDDEEAFDNIDEIEVLPDGSWSIIKPKEEENEEKAGTQQKNSLDNIEVVSVSSSGEGQSPVPKKQKLVADSVPSTKTQVATTVNHLEKEKSAQPSFLLSTSSHAESATMSNKQPINASLQLNKVQPSNASYAESRPAAFPQRTKEGRVTPSFSQTTVYGPNAEITAVYNSFIQGRKPWLSAPSGVPQFQNQNMDFTYLPTRNYNNQQPLPRKRFARKLPQNNVVANPVLNLGGRSAIPRYPPGRMLQQSSLPSSSASPDRYSYNPMQINSFNMAGRNISGHQPNIRSNVRYGYPNNTGIIGNEQKATTDITLEQISTLEDDLLPEDFA